ncbi:hypothetical protein K9N50_02345 [bacterium]|nr:hypothetical protein [bacterium]
MKTLLKCYSFRQISSWRKTLFSFLLLSYFIGCNFNESSPSGPSNNDVTALDLLPVAVGNRWCVEGSQNGVVQGYETREVIKDTLVNGRQCFEVQFTWDNINPERSFGHTWFYSLGDSNIFRMKPSWQSWSEFPEFKNFPNALIGDTIHIEEYNDADYMARRIYTVYDKNASKNVKAGLFNNCYVIKYDFIYTNFGELDRHEVYIDYYAPDVGFIWEKDSCYYSNGESEIWIWDLIEYDVNL